MDDVIAPPPPLTAARRELLKLLLDQNGRRSPQSPEHEPAGLVPLPPGAERPLSLAQERIWLSTKLAGESVGGTYTGTTRLAGPLDVAVLRRAIEEVFRRHEILRSSFPGDLQPAIAVHADVRPEVPLVDLSSLPDAQRAAALRQLIESESHQLFQLDRWPLLRLLLVRLADEEHLLVGSIHHLVGDGWSSGLFNAEMSRLYAAFQAGLPSPLPPPPLQYADYAAWQRQWAEGPKVQEHIAYWKRQLSGQIPPLELPADRPRSATRTFRGGTYAFDLPAPLAEGILELGRAAGTTPFITLLAAFATLLHRASGQDEFAIGSPVANRHRRELESIVGCFMHPLVLRCNLSGDPTFGEVLDRVREVCHSAYAHQDAPFELVMRAVRPQWDMIHAPLFQVVFNVQKAELQRLALGGLQSEPGELHSPASALDLSVNLFVGDGRVRGVIEYAAELFDEATIAWLVRCYRSLIESIVADPRQTLSALPITGRAKRQAVPAALLAPNLSPQRRELLQHLLGQQPDDSDLSTIRRLPRTGEPLPCSFGQERLWLVDQLQHGSPIYNQSQSLELQGPLDVAALRRALDEIIRRHEILRTGIVATSGGPVQVVHPEVESPLTFCDLSQLAGEDQAARSQQLLDDLASQPFRLEEPPLARAVLMRLSPARHLLGMTVHHLITDGWSMRAFRRELSELYSAFASGRDAALPPLPIQYADFAHWQRKSTREAVLQGQLTYWKYQLSGELPRLDLPADRQRLAARSISRNTALAFALPKSLNADLARLQRDAGATPFMVLLSAFFALLHRYGGQDDLIVDTPISGRGHRDLEGLIGFFVNSLALRVDLSGRPDFRSLLTRVRKACLEAYANQDIPFDQVVSRLRLDRDRRGQPLTPVSFMLHETVVKHEELGAGVSIVPGPYGLSDEFDLTLVVWQGPAGFSGELQYDPRLFAPETADRIVAHFQTLLAELLASPDRPLADLALLPASEQALVLREWSGAASAEAPGRCIQELFEEQVRASPQAVAVVVPAEAASALTYDQLNRRANQLARLLRSQGIGREDRVGICLDRSADLIVAVWAVLKSGAAFVPLDPGYSSQRHFDMIRDARVKLLITERGLLDPQSIADVPMLLLGDAQNAIANQSDQNLNLAQDDRQLAYVVYTSGSTGKPKGVMVSHRSLVSAYRAWESAYRLDESRSHLQMASFSFDVFLGDFVRALCSGARLVLCPRDALLMPSELAALLADHEIDCAEFVPAVVRMLLEHLRETGQRLDRLKLAIVGSDTWTAAEYEQVRRIVSPGTRVVNSYGVAEATIDSSFFERSAESLNGDQQLPVGRPFAGSQLLVLDRYLQPVPIGVPGELYLGGVGLARGYFDRPVLTAERFVPHPFSPEPGCRLYRTGDRARWLADGNLEFLGRVDQQLKIRGFRIEPGEIEAVLAEHPGVQQAVVLPFGEANDRRLVAYLTAVGGYPIDESELRRFIETRLPSYMVPSALMPLAEFPLSPNGKIDRRALPRPEIGRTDEGATYRPPSTPTELTLAQAWTELLAVDRVAADDDFFALGGHSLLAARLVARIRRDLDVELPLRSLFENPSLTALARAVDAARGGDSVALPPVKPASRDLPIPLSYAQEGAWLIDQLQPGVPFNIVWPMHLAGRLDLGCLRRALDEIVRRHAVLRTTFESIDGQPQQVVHPPTSLPLELVDLSSMAGADEASEVQRRVLSLAHHVFDLSRGPLAQMTAFQLSRGEHLLVFTVHHSVFDGWSLKVFAREFSVLYAAFVASTLADLPALPVQYADYAHWQREILQGEFYERQLEYWRNQLADCPAGLALATDRRHSSAPLFDGAIASRPFAPALIRSLRKLAQGEGVTLFMLLGAAFKTLLARYTGQDDLVVGTPIANRGQEEMTGVIGFCVNLLALRTSLAGNPSFRELLARERRTCLGGFDHQELPFGRLVQELDPVRSVGHSPFFQVQFALHEAQSFQLELPGLEPVTADPSDGALAGLMGLLANAQPATDHLFLNVIDTPTGVGAWMHYRADLFSEESVLRMLAHLERLLEGIAADADQPIWQLPLLTGDERLRLVDQWSRGLLAAAPGPCIHRLFEDQVRLTPDAVAVNAPAGNAADSLTYDQLNRRANQLSRHLRLLGIGTEDRVGICLDRSTDLIVAVWGVLKAGAAFVPLDAGYSSQRLADMVRDAGLKLLLTQDGLLDEQYTAGVPVLLLDRERNAIAAQLDDNLALPADHRQLAYVVYTSGSTGKPKGVMVSHGSLVNAYRAWEVAYGLRECRSHLQMASFSFDVFVGDLVRALCSGAHLVLCPRDSLLDPEQLTTLLQTYEVDCAEFVPAVVRVLIEHLHETGQRLERLQLAIVGSDTWHAAEYEQVRRFVGPQARVINSYGVAEATIDSSFFESHVVQLASDQQLPIGRPLAGCDLIVLDRMLEPAPIGVPGELYLGGEGLARGYLGRPGQTGERFVPHPFSHQPGERLYRTGDRARWLADGNLEFLGRVDQQIKIRGFRIEPAEVEAAIAEHPAVQQAVVMAHGESTGEQRLVAYLTRADGGSLDEAGLRAYLDSRLPAYMVPSVLILLDELPLSPNGKVNRRALPAPSADRIDRSAQYEPPRTLTELGLARIWSDVLAVERVGIHDDFFALGGHSLLAARLVARIRRELAVELPLRTLFEHPALAALARAIDAARGGASALLPPIESIPREGRIPLSYAQEGAWLVDQLQPGVPFNIPLPLHLKGEIDLPSLERALARVVARHEALRTRFAADDGQPYQVIADAGAPPLSVVDLRALPADGRRHELVSQLLDAAGRPFDLKQSPLARLIIYRIADDEQLFLFVAHHIVFDGHSVGVLARDLTALYAAEARGTEAALPELPIQYADYAAWQRRVLSGEFLEAELGYWRKQLADCPTGLNLPVERQKKQGELYRGDTVAALLSEETSGKLRALAQREGVTLFMLLLAAFKALLTRYSGQEDIVVGTPVANRNQLEMADVIGFCVNMLALRTNLAGNPTFRELLAREREVCLAAYSHQEVPLGLLVQHLRPDRHVSHSPFFSIGFALQPAPPQTDEVGGLAVAPVVDDDAKALLAELERRRRDITPATDLLFLQTADTGRQIAAIMHHSSAAFSSATIERMMGHFERLLAAITADPGRPIWDLPLLAADERRLLLDRFSCGDVPIDEHGQDVCLHELVEAQAERTPVAPAIVFAVPQGTADEGDSGETLTYGELNRRANQLAHLLRSLGVGPESRVAVLLDRTPNALVALLGVLKAGGVFVPLDANYPRERMALLYEDAKPSVVVTLEKFAQGVPLDRSRIVCLDVDAPALREQITHNPCGGAHAENAAYVIYTSGSTGRPKGVVVPHRSVVNHNQAAARRFGLVASDRVLQFHSISFDAAIEEIFPTWICGATLVMRGDDLILPGAELHDFIRRYGLTVLDLPTAYWHQWMDSAQHDHDIPPEPLRLVIVGGDQVSPERYAAWRALCGERIRWLNTYGPTETTIISTCDEPAPQPAEENPDWYITVGRPIDHTQAFVLDPRLELAPIGVPGELYLGGRGVARGYHERPGLTADRFVPDPLGGVPGARLYRTGDRARYLPDGRIEFLGRIDQQLKIRGFRVEPGEIVAALRQHPGVREALVVGHGEAGDKRLVAYVAKTAGAQVGPDDLRSFLQGKLPGYMVPAALIVLDDFPLTPGGKIDRRALPDPAGMRSELSHDYVAPQTPTEIELARIWSEVLSVERVGTRDNFFALGGHSLLAARLVARVRGEMGRDLALRTLFERPTIAALAEELARLPPDGDRRDWPAELVTIQPHGSRPPLFVLHAADGNVVNYLPLARHLGEDQPLMGLQHPGLAGEEIGDWSIEQLATRYADVLCAVQPQGPYFLAGWSLGGVLAYELARELTARGEAVGLVALVDAWAWDGAAAERQATANRQAFGAQAGMPLELFLALSPDEQVRFVLDKIQSATEESDEVALIERLANEMAIPIDQAIFLLEEAVPSGQSDRWTAVLDRARERHGTIAPARREQLRRQLGVVRSILDAVGSYRLSTYSGPVTLLKAEQTATGGSSLGWTTLADGGVETVDLPGHHFSLLREPHVRRVAEELTKLLHPTPES